MSFIAARRAALLLTALLLPAAPLVAQWDPPNGDWLKEDATDVRIMTYNVQDSLCSTENKSDGLNNWTALARIVAAFKPDVLMLQECGDNNGNGTGGSSDSVSNLTTALELFMHGGSDPFNGGTVGAYVQKYDPSYDLPHIFVSNDSDGFNRNVIMSRFPFMDLNGDTKATYSDTPIIFPDEYATGFDGGLRGFGVAEIDLPDATHAGDLVVGNSHLKCCSGSSNHDQRIKAAQNIAYFIDYFYNGAGTGVPDPNDSIIDSPPATSVLDANTFFVAGGDWNEDEGSNGTKGPADWITKAALTGGSDGTDKDGSDMTFDNSVDMGGSDATQSSSKLDHIAWQDSVATLRRSFVFNSSVVQFNGGQLPPEVLGFQFASGITGVASDHKAVIVDLIPPLVGGGCPHVVSDLGFAHPGVSGDPSFFVTGCLGPGDVGNLILTNAAPFANAWPVAALAALPTPFKGGTLVPIPPIVLGPFPTGAPGSVLLNGIDGGFGPLTIVMQWVIQDAAASQGFAMSNALEITWG